MAHHPSRRVGALIVHPTNGFGACIVALLAQKVPRLSRKFILVFFFFFYSNMTIIIKGYVDFLLFYCVYRYHVPQLSSPWTFAPIIPVRSGQLYNFTKATKNTIQALQHRFSINTPIMCGACITDKRCQRCQRVSTNRSAVCGNMKHMFCQQCIQDMPDFFNQQRDVSEYTSVSGYNPQACNKMGGPYCWLCWTPGKCFISSCSLHDRYFFSLYVPLP